MAVYRIQSVYSVQCACVIWSTDMQWLSNVTSHVTSHVTSPRFPNCLYARAAHIEATVGGLFSMSIHNNLFNLRYGCISLLAL